MLARSRARRTNRLVRVRVGDGCRIVARGRRFPNATAHQKEHTTMAARSRARAHWEGSTVDGAGHVSTTTDALHEHPLLWTARIGEQEGTTPEELLAASWAGCYSMAFSFALTGNGHPPTSLDVDAELAFVPKDGGGFDIGKGKLVVRAEVPGISDELFAELAAGAKAGCPVSVALGSIAEQATLDATLTTAAAGA
jgi:osmotically inducible protein OsmC